MNKRIVYQNDKGGISIIIPAEEEGACPMNQHHIL
jgi:hypothetical protein